MLTPAAGTVLEKLIERKAIEMGVPNVRPNWVDRVVGYLSPAAALRRQQARISMASSFDAFQGARRDRIFESWLASAASMDADLIAALPLLRQRARELERNDAIGTALVKGWVRGVVGAGMICSPQVDAEHLALTDAQATAFNDSARRWFECFAMEASADRKMSFEDLQRLIVKREAVDGEVPILITSVKQPGREVSTAIEVIEPERVDTPTDLVRDAAVRAGIRRGPAGEMLGAYVSVAHPGDIGLQGATPSSKAAFRFYPARDESGRRVMLHFFECVRAGQTRGLTKFSSNMTRLHNLGQFLTGEEVAKRIESCIGVAIKKKGVFSQRAQQTRSRDFEMQPGFMLEQGPDEDITFFDPKRPGSNFAPYVEFVIRMIGASWDMPMELFLLDFSESSWSNARAAAVEAFIAWETKRDHVVGAVFQPIYAAVLEEGILRGAVEMPAGADFYGERKAWTRCEWIPDPRPWVDPQNEASAIETELEMGLTTKTIEARKRGRRFSDLVRQRGEEKEMERAAGLSAPDPQQGGEGGGEQPPGGDGDDANPINKNRQPAVPAQDDDEG